MAEYPVEYLPAIIEAMMKIHITWTMGQDPSWGESICTLHEHANEVEKATCKAAREEWQEDMQDMVCQGVEPVKCRCVRLKVPPDWPTWQLSPSEDWSSFPDFLNDPYYH